MIARRCSAMIVAFAILSPQGVRAATGLDVLDQAASSSKRVTVAMESPDDEFDLQRSLEPLLERNLIAAGYQVANEPEGADLVLVPTAGWISARGAPRGSLTSLSHDEGNSNSADRKRALFPDSQTIVQCGLLISAYKVSDWQAMPFSGKVPKPVWRIYETMILPKDPAVNVGELLVRKCMADLPEFKKR